MAKLYSDFNINFFAHPATGDIARVYDGNSIAQSIKNLILTNYNEVPFSPWIGANLTALLFEPVSPMIEDAIENNIRDAITKHEPRAIVSDLKVSYNEAHNSYDVWMSFNAIGLDRPVTVNFVLKRVR